MLGGAHDLWLEAQKKHRAKTRVLTISIIWYLLRALTSLSEVLSHDSAFVSTSLSEMLRHDRTNIGTFLRKVLSHNGTRIKNNRKRRFKSTRTLSSQNSFAIALDCAGMFRQKCHALHFITIKK